MIEEKNNIKNLILQDKYSTLDLSYLVDTIKDKLKLTKEMEDIDYNLILLAFTHESAIHKIPDIVKEEEYERYGTNDYKPFEYVGDRILEFITVTQLIKLNRVMSIHELDDIKIELVRNRSLRCFMEKKGLCDFILYDPAKMLRFKEEHAKKSKEERKRIEKMVKEEKIEKMCSDVFEAILGILYHHLYYQKGMKFMALEEIEKWLIDYWNLNEKISEVLDGKEVCKIK